MKRYFYGWILIFTCLIAVTDRAGAEMPLRSSLFPVDFQNGSYSLLPDLPGILLLDLYGEASQVKTLPVTLELELPDFIRLIGATVNLPENRNGIDHFPVLPLSRTSLGSWQLTIPPSLLSRLQPKQPSWRNHLMLCLAANASTQQEGMARYRLKTDQQTADWQNFRLQVLPPLPANRRPARSFATVAGYASSQLVPFPEVNQAYRNYWTSLTARPKFFPAPWQLPQTRRQEIVKSFEPVIMLGGGPSMPMLKSLKTGTAIAAQLPLIQDRNGQPIIKNGMAFAAPAYVLEDPQGIIWDQLVPREIRRKLDLWPEAKSIVWDYEPGADHGYSEANRRLFAQQFNLPDVPDTAAIRANYLRQWQQFRLLQHTRTVRKFAQSVHRHFPGKLALLCTDNLHADGDAVTSWCAVDPRQTDSSIDGYMNMPYYCGVRFFNDVAFNQQALKKPNLYLIDPAEKIQSFYRRYTPGEVLQNLIATAALGSEGLGFWPDDWLDGTFLQAIAEGFQAIAQVEDLYRGERCDRTLQAEAVNVYRQTLADEGRTLSIALPDFSNDLKILFHRRGSDGVITALNYHTGPVMIRAAVPGLDHRSFSVQELLTGQILTDADPAKGFLFTVPEKGAAIIKIGTVPPPAGLTPVRQSELETALQAQLATLQKTFSFQTVSNDGVTISWSCLPGSTTPCLKVQTPTGKLYLNPITATVSGWKRGRSHDLVTYGKNRRGTIGELLLHDQRQSRPLRFQLTRQLVDDTGARLVFETMISPSTDANPEENPLEGLKITKEFLISRDVGTLEIRTVMTNLSPRRTPMEVNFRFRNIIYPGDTFGKYPPLAITTLDLNHQILPDAKELLYLRSGIVPPFPTACHPQLWDGQPLTVTAQFNRNWEQTVFLLPETMAGFYRFRASTFFTVEPIATVRRLAPGADAAWAYQVRYEPRKM